MEKQRKRWNKRQGELRTLLESGEDHLEAIQLFLSQHAPLHSAEMDHTESWSFEDEILNDLVEETVRRIPADCEHSIAWCIWHIARIEDVTMNMLIAGSAQLLHVDKWQDRMGISAVDTGNLMDEENVAELSATIDISSLREYRLAVGRRTREIVMDLQPGVLRKKVDPIRLQRVVDEGAVVQSALGLIEYWGKRTVAGLLLMPPTRHNFVHLNEATGLKQRRR
ncbi:MAG: DinB family protein [Candidatus Promineifilaceae bacterium]